MANSKYEYVRSFEREEHLLPNTWIVVRVDGRGFHKLSSHYNFTKPNDLRALNLMNAAAKHVLRTITDITFAYGVSDEYSFVFTRDTQLFERRRDKIVSTVVSTFTAGYIHHWNEFFCAPGNVPSSDDITAIELNTKPATSNTPASFTALPLDPSFLPTFDARPILYPSTANLRDYLSWRQVDCHVNNLYNTTFWALVQQGKMSTREAEQELKGTVASEKNEILWGRFGTNYNDMEAVERKGSCVFRGLGLGLGAWVGQGGGGGDGVGLRGEGVGGTEKEDVADDGVGRVEQKEVSKTQKEKMRKERLKATIVVEHVDIIKDDFWQQRPWILGGRDAR